MSSSARPRAVLVSEINARLRLNAQQREKTAAPKDPFHDPPPSSLPPLPPSPRRVVQPPPTAPPRLLSPASLPLSPSIRASAGRRMAFRVLGSDSPAAFDSDEEDGDEVEVEGGTTAAAAEALTSSAPPILLLGSAAFESKAVAVERGERQHWTKHSPSAFPFLHRLNVHAATQQRTQQPSQAEEGEAVALRSAAAVPAMQLLPSAAASVAAEPSPRQAAASVSTAIGAELGTVPAPSSASSSSMSPKSYCTLVQLCCEVLSSEATYVSRLDDLLLRYVTPLKVRYQQLGVAREDVDGLFSYIEPIVDLHHKLLEQVMQVEPPLPPTSSSFLPSSADVAALDRCVLHVSSTFLQYLPYCKMYVQYVNSYNAAMEALKRLSEGRKFVAFLATTHRPPILDLPSYLIMPIQRIPRYEMLLSSLSRLCDSSSLSSSSSLHLCLSSVQSLAALINESKRAAENASKMVELKRRLKGFPSSVSLLAPHRRLLREDAVVQLRPKRREYVLVTFNDAVLLVSHAWRVKGFYTSEDLHSIRHYEPHQQLLSAQTSPHAATEDASERVVEGGAEGSDDEGDDSAYACSVEVELKKKEGAAAAAGGGGAGGGGGGDGRLKLKRFSLAFTAAIAALTDQHSVVLQFPSEADKAAWVCDLHRATSAAAGGAGGAGGLTFGPSLLSSSLKSSAPPSQGLGGRGTSSPSASPLPSPSSSPHAGPALSSASTPSATGPSPSPVLSPSFALQERLPSVGAVPVLPARPKPQRELSQPMQSRVPVGAAASSSLPEKGDGLVSSSSGAAAPPSPSPSPSPFSYTRPPLAVDGGGHSTFRGLLLHSASAPPSPSSTPLRSPLPSPARPLDDEETSRPHIPARPPLLSDFQRLHSAAAPSAAPSTLQPLQLLSFAPSASHSSSPSRSAAVPAASLVDDKENVKGAHVAELRRVLALPSASTAAHLAAAKSPRSRPLLSTPSKAKTQREQPHTQGQTAA